ncbi:MAG: hypothetical protein WC889_15440, partial [Myxococcota bacterium]
MKTARAGTTLLRFLILCAFTLLFVPGCALFSKGDQKAARFFSLVPASAQPGAVPAAAPAAKKGTAELRLGHVTGAPYLEERLVYRDSANEIN